MIQFVIFFKLANNRAKDLDYFKTDSAGILLWEYTLQTIVWHQELIVVRAKGKLLNKYIKKILQGQGRQLEQYWVCEWLRLSL